MKLNFDFNQYEPPKLDIAMLKMRVEKKKFDQLILLVAISMTSIYISLFYLASQMMTIDVQMAYGILSMTGFCLVVTFLSAATLLIIQYQRRILL